jgi:hypothetical protein
MRIFHYVIMFGFLIAFDGSAQDEQDYKEYLAQKELSPVIVKSGGGIGAAFGGCYGINTEIGFGYVSLLGAVGMTFPNTTVNPRSPASSYLKPAWQIGARVYLASSNTKLRPALSVFYGPVYIYQVESSDTTLCGMLMCTTPVLSIEHDIGKPRGIVLTYGIGPVIHESIPEKVDEAIVAITGKKTLISFSVNLGINYQLNMKRRK